MFWGGESTYTGLDIGASAVKVVRGKVKKDRFVVEDLHIEPLNYNIHNEQGIADPEALSSSIARAIEGLKSAEKKCSIGIHGGGVLIKRITIPKVPEKDIPDQVRWEAEQVFPVDVDSILIDYVLLGEGPEVPGAPPGTKGWDLLLVGVQMNDAEAIRSCAESAGAEIKILDLDAFVSSSFIAKLVEVPKNEAIAFVDVGASATRVSVYKEDKVVFIREFPMGGRFFTEAISAALGLSFEDAEALKIQDVDSIPEEAVSALQNAIVQWKQELQQSEDIFVTQDSIMVSKWYFFGGASQTPGLLGALQEERFASKVFTLPYHELFEAKGKVDANIVGMWAPRLISSSALAVRKG